MIEKLFRFVEMLGVAALVRYAGTHTHDNLLKIFGYLLLALATFNYGRQLGIAVKERGEQDGWSQVRALITRVSSTLLMTAVSLFLFNRLEEALILIRGD